MSSFSIMILMITPTSCSVPVSLWIMILSLTLSLCNLHVDNSTLYSKLVLTFKSRDNAFFFTWTFLFIFIFYCFLFLPSMGWLRKHVRNRLGHCGRNTHFRQICFTVPNFILNIYERNFNNYITIGIIFKEQRTI